MEYLALSVALLCGAGLISFRWWLDSKPPITRQEYEEVLKRLGKIEAGMFSRNVGGRAV